LIGGISQFIIDLAGDLDRRGHEVVVVAFTPGDGRATGRCSNRQSPAVAWASASRAAATSQWPPICPVRLTARSWMG
jgi:hypothetical protein